MAAQAMADALAARNLIIAHVKECADNYRSLTRWVIATLMTVCGCMAMFLLNFAFQHLK